MKPRNPPPQEMMKSINRLSLDALTAGDKTQMKRFTESLNQNGFAVVHLEGDHDAGTLSTSLFQCRNMNEFRFPPIDGSVQYLDAHMECFKVLFRITRCCLQALLMTSKEHNSAKEALLDALEASFSPDYKLFFPPGKDAQPFPSNDVAFSTSFLNIFNYDHGLLNTHRDRCLVTAISVNQNRAVDAPKSALWVKGREGEWVNTDALVGDNEVVILVGEELQKLAESLNVPVWAAEHCIRVDPHGPNLERAHHRSDPATPKTGNRLSAALVLSH